MYRAVESEFRITFIGAFLVVLIILLVCMIVCMLIRCIREMVRGEYRDTGENTQHGSGRKWDLMESRL